MAGQQTATTATQARTDAPAPGLAGRRRSLWGRGNWVPKTLSVLVLLLVWQLISFGYAAFLPGPASTLRRVLDLVASGEFFRQALPTILRVLAGFALAMVVGTAVGIFMGARRSLESFFELYVLVGLTVPGLAWAVLALMWFGISEIAPVFAILAVVWPMLAVNLWQGTKALDRDLLEMAQAFKIARHRVVRDIVLPQLLPYLLAGSRFGFALGWKVVVLSEVFGLSSGIGYMINRSFSNYSLLNVLAWTISFSLVMGLFEYGVLRPLERHLLRWRPAVAL